MVPWRAKARLLLLGARGRRRAQPYRLLDGPSLGRFNSRLVLTSKLLVDPLLSSFIAARGVF